MAAYAAEMRVAEARERYFAEGGLPADGGYDADWVRFRVGPFPVAFPNTAGRRAAVPCHDLHHVATGYATDLAGEGEIGAWEVASGCFQVRAAWWLGMLSVWPGLFFALPRIYRAFVRVRHSRNLYAETAQAWEDRRVGELRAHLGLDAAAPAPSRADRIAFAGFLAKVVGIQLAIAALLFGPPLWWWLAR